MKENPTFAFLLLFLITIGTMCGIIDQHNRLIDIERKVSEPRKYHMYYEYNVYKYEDHSDTLLVDIVQEEMN